MDHCASASIASSSMHCDDNAPSSATVDDARATGSGQASKLGMSSRNSGRGSSGNASCISSPTKFFGVVVPRLSTRSASSRKSTHLGHVEGIDASSGSSDPDPQSTAQKTLDPAASFTGSLAESISTALGAEGAGIEDEEDVSGEEEILELISPEVARDYHTDVTAASDEPEESDDELLALAYPPSGHHQTRTTVQETLEERETHAHNGMAFTGSIVDALANAFAANEDESIPSSSSSASRARPTRQSLFLEASSGSDSDTPEPPSSPSRPVPEREPRASLRVAQSPRSHAAHTVELKTATDNLDEYLETEYATHAYQKEWNSPPLQNYKLPPVSSEAREPIVVRRPQYTSVTEHFLQRAEEWFGPEALRQVDQAVLDGPAKNVKKGTSSAKPSAPNSVPKSDTAATKLLKRKRVPSVAESIPQKGPRVLEELNGVPSRSSQENARRTLSAAEPSLSASDVDLLRRFVTEKKIPTDEDVNALNHLVSSLEMEGEHNVFEGKTTANGHFHILVPKKLVAIASRA